MTSNLLLLYAAVHMLLFGNETATLEPVKFYLYVGSYTTTDKEGIAIFEFDPLDGDLKYLTTVAGIKNPSYLAIHPKKKLLFAVNETDNFGAGNTGAISSYAIDPIQGSLRLLSQVSSLGVSPCYVTIDQSGSNALVANYSSGNVAVFPVESGGILSQGSMVQHQGSGPNKDRQSGPHAHSIMFDNKYAFALAADLGTDKVYSYAIGKNPSSLMLQNEFSLSPGAGPRHLDFHPNNKFVYVINELNSTITACTYDAKTGKLTEISSVSTLPEGFSGANSCADIHISKDGRFVYGSNRGHDSIVVFAVDQSSGKLTLVSHHPVKGKTPRNFMIDPTGKFLLVANQNSNNIIVFKVDTETGKLIFNGVEVKTPKPVCLKMFSVK